MPGPSPYTDDWRDCLRAHFQHVVRTHDTATERTLIDVLHEVGFGDRELAELKVLATLRADEAPDFVPDVERLTAQMLAQMQPPEPEPVIYAAAVADEGEAEVDAVIEDAPPLAGDAPDEAGEVDGADEPPDDPPEYRADGPQQMSLF